MKALFTRILSIGKGKGKEKKEKSSVRLVEGEGGKSWQNTSGTRVVTSPLGKTTCLSQARFGHSFLRSVMIL